MDKVEKILEKYKIYLVSRMSSLGSEGLLELYVQTVRPTMAYALDVSTATWWRLASAVALCV